MIPISKTYFDEEDYKMILEPLKSGWVVQGEYVKKFENMFAKFIGSAECAAATSCTTALHLITAALGLKKGDEVIVPSFTWIATANCVEYTGAKAVFADVDLETFNINVNSLENLITENTKAIIPVHLFGLTANMDAVLKIAKKYKLLVIEDAACAFDSWYKGKHAGTMGDAGAFSFHPRKSITTGEGGMCATNNTQLAKKFKSLRDHGASRERTANDYSFLLPEYGELGFNYRMTDFQGALGVSQMNKSGKIMESRRKAAETLYDQLRELDWLQLPYKHEDYIHGFQSFVCLYRPEEPALNNLERLFEQRNKLMKILEENGISTRQGTHSAAHTSYYAKKYGITQQDIPNSLIAEKCTIALPLFAGIKDEEIESVVQNVKSAFKKIY